MPFQEPFGEEVLLRKGSFMDAYEYLERKEGEPVRKWLSRHTTTEEKLKEVGINLAVQDNEQRAHRLLARTCVSEE